MLSDSKGPIYNGKHQCFYNVSESTPHPNMLRMVVNRNGSLYLGMLAVIRLNTISAKEKNNCFLKIFKAKSEKKKIYTSPENANSANK